MEDYKKKYEEALERANAKIETYNHLGNASVVKSICEIFPELKENEDEKIRKELIRAFTVTADKKSHEIYGNGITYGQVLAWLEKQSTPQVRKGNEWVNIIDDACEHRYAEEYAHGEYCHQQSFRWGFQEGVDWLEKQGKKIDVIENFDTEFEKQVSYLLASTINKEHEYNEDFVKWTANSLLNYAKYGLEKKGEHKCDCKHVGHLKQSEQNDNKVLKFKTGDWVVSPNGVYWHIDRIKNNRYEVTSDTGKCADWALDTDLYHHWTIKDAKDGDVLAVDGGSGICIFDGTIEEGIYPFAYCGLTRYGFEFYDRKLPFTHDKDIHPATKEQCDLLFQKMKEAGYEWDAEKKELKKIKKKIIEIPFGTDSELIEETITIPNGCYAVIEDNKVILRKGEQKPAWSEEDERNLEGIINEIEANKNNAPDYDLATYDRFLSWLKSLKDRVQPQPKQEWSKEDERIFTLCAVSVKTRYNDGLLTHYEYELASLWLESIKERMKGE